MVSGEKIKELRENKKMSLDEVSKNAKIPTKMLKEIEEGKKELSSKIFERLIPVLDIKEVNDLSWHKLVTGDMGTKIRALREKQGFTLQQLSVLCEISLTYLSEIELGNKVPSFSTLRSISDALQVPISLFVGNKRKQSVIGDKLKRARVLAGKTQKDLSEESGVSNAMIAQLENGKIQASLNTIEQISNTLGVSVCYLILEQEEVEEMIGAITPEMRDLLYDTKVQSIIGSICTMDSEDIIMVLNFVNMLKNPYIKK